jgi:cell wall-associated NlpC family hydrolase
MSLEAAIGRIDQILQLQQQIFPSAGGSSAAAATGGVAPTATTGATGATTGDPTGSTDSTANQAAFAAALADAQAASASADAASPVAAAGTTSSGATPSLTDPLSSGVLDSLSPAALSSASTLSSVAQPLATNAIASPGTSSAPASVQAMVDAANSLVGKPYIWGGGHSGWGQQPGYDCSGFVSAVLHAGGYLSSPQDTQTLPSATGIESGPGQYVTIYDRTDAGGDDHVIINLNGQFYESGGESGAWGGGGGVERIATPTASYLASFNQILHPTGL